MSRVRPDQNFPFILWQGWLKFKTIGFCKQNINKVSKGLEYLIITLVPLRKCLNLGAHFYSGRAVSQAWCGDPHRRHGEQGPVAGDHCGQDDRTAVAVSSPSTWSGTVWLPENEDDWIVFFKGIIMKIFAALGHLTPSERESDIFLIFKFFKCSFRAVRGSNYLYTVQVVLVGFLPLREQNNNNIYFIIRICILSADPRGLR